MGLFDRSVSLGESGFFQDYTDHHCHILPGVDDGVKTLDDSLAILAAYEAAGIRTVWLTPHIMEDIPNTTSSLRQSLTTLQLAYKGSVSLRLAAENMLDSLFEERLAARDLLPMDGRKLLVETSYFNPPMDLGGILERIRLAGYYPMLAHPERYMYMDLKDYKNLKSKGVLFQLNLPSLNGSYGPEVQAKAFKLLSEGMYDISGTDLHRASSFDHLLEARLKTRFIRNLTDLR